MIHSSKAMKLLVKHTLKCQINRDLNKQGSEKILNVNKRGVRINGGGVGNWKELKIIINRGEKQKQVVIFAGSHCSSNFSRHFLEVVCQKI